MEIVPGKLVLIKYDIWGKAVLMGVMKSTPMSSRQLRVPSGVDLMFWDSLIVHYLIRNLFVLDHQNHIWPETLLWW